MCRQEGAYAVREEFPQALRGRGGTVLAPWGPTTRQEQGRGGGRTRPRPGDSRRGVIPPGKWSRGPAGSKAIVDSMGCSTSCCCCTPACPGGDAVPRRLHRRGAGEPGEAGADAVGPVVSTKSVPCVGLLEGVGWATAVAAAEASAEPVLTSVCTAKTEANRCRLQAKSARGRGSDRRW